MPAHIDLDFFHVAFNQRVQEIIYKEIIFQHQHISLRYPGQPVDITCLLLERRYSISPETF